MILGFYEGPAEAFAKRLPGQLSDELRLAVGEPVAEASSRRTTAGAGRLGRKPGASWGRVTTTCASASVPPPRSEPSAPENSKQEMGEFCLSYILKSFNVLLIQIIIL